MIDSFRASRLLVFTIALEQFKVVLLNMLEEFVTFFFQIEVHSHLLYLTLKRQKLGIKPA